ncbi:MAG: hypothetical protein A3J27_09675 [Candidatus Tectomicrobia bacterium RIFCSPLOWO2_12_FULL_69_37]|nr:MAG: hypothetical protein A3I72_04250 [Candidatus Tectomicrobia bacterium RIFCSPLOWO2_02_FULL_70_19]OGL61728.1 MAG: hypothetical protein A3J27_09675 [Candidatus Tectomicrobia bacterium RIFCSPLOWO2_12_FULL_69_37]
MQADRAPGPLSRYLELGVRIHLDDFPQISVVVLLFYLPLAYLALLLHPPLQALLRPGGGDLLILVPRMLIAQAMLRMAQLFVFILLVLRLDAQRRSRGDAWDLAETLGRLWRVARVDLAYAFGLQALAILVLWLSMGVLGFFLGSGPLIFPAALAVTAFAVITPAIRFYFCAFASLLHGDGFRAAFQRSSRAAPGAERLISLLVLTYLLVWFVIWQVAHGIFGGGVLGQLFLHAGVMLTSVSYFFAAYGLYLDLTPPLPGEAQPEGGALPLPPGG